LLFIFFRKIKWAFKKKKWRQRKISYLNIYDNDVIIISVARNHMKMLKIKKKKNENIFISFNRNVMKTHWNPRCKWSDFSSITWLLAFHKQHTVKEWEEKKKKLITKMRPRFVTRKRFHFFIKCCRFRFDAINFICEFTLRDVNLNWRKRHKHKSFIHV
jgi:hypothetical protein